MNILVSSKSDVRLLIKGPYALATSLQRRYIRGDNRGVKYTVLERVTSSPEQLHVPDHPHIPPDIPKVVITSVPTRMTVAERDAALMDAWRDREGTLANAEFEDGQVESGYRRNIRAPIFRYFRYVPSQ